MTAVWVGRDDNTAMKRVTGGGAPAGIWHDYMTAALPRLRTEVIPGGAVAPPPEAAPAPDVIGDILSGPSTPAPASPSPADKTKEDIPF